jgi:hypothetical protein
MEKNEEELENQLHQQYAENDNSRSGVFTSFIIGIVALFGVYGYVFVNTSETKRDCWNFDVQEFLLMSFVTMGILFFLAILALYLGYALRRDQFVVNRIREKRYKKETKMKKIFGESYKPSGKCPCDFLPDYYNLFYMLFFFSEIFIHITTIIKICDIKNDDVIQFCKYQHILYLVILLHILFISLTLIFRRCYYNKYKKLEKCSFHGSIFKGGGGLK